MLLSWDAPDADAESVTGYRILRRDPDRQRRLRVLVENTGSTETTYFDSTTKDGRRYTYRIYALRGDHASKVSNFNVRRYRKPSVPVPTSTATYTPSPTATPGQGLKSVQPPKVEAPADGPRDVVRQAPAGATGDILVANTGLSLAAYSASDSHAQGFTTGPTPYRLTGVEIRVNGVGSGESFSLGISEDSGNGRPGTVVYELESPATQSGATFFAAPEGAVLKTNTQYFVHFTLNTGDAFLGDTASNSEDATSKPGWSVADSSWAKAGPVWLSRTVVYSVTVRGVEIDDAGESTSAAISLNYSRASGESPYAREYVSNEHDVDWFGTAFFMDTGGRYRIDIDPVNLTDDSDLQVSAFYVDYPGDHSKDDFLELEELTDPPEGLVSHYFKPTRPHGPYLKVWADNGTVGEYRIRVVYDPVKTWNGSESSQRRPAPRRHDMGDGDAGHYPDRRLPLLRRPRLVRCRTGGGRDLRDHHDSG